MQRGEFIATLAAFAAARGRRSNDDAQTQALRVLLGEGDAQDIDGQSFSYEGRRYRGTFSVNGGRVISTVPLEQYLYSVVPREMPHSWPDAALDAQAIVARTFVLQRSSPDRDYDLIPSEADQVYTGMDSERPETAAAVDRTAGQVLRFGNGFAQGLYSSCCGGHTEASSDAWGGKPVPYLGGVPCTYCTASTWYSWSQDIALDQFAGSLQGLLPQGDVNNISLDAIDRSGRARFWTFESEGSRVSIPAAKVRAAVGGRVLPSLRVRTLRLSSQAPRTVTIEGAGLGHGVGLCQWGARGMALQGADARKILGFYYPGTGIGND